MKKYLMLVLVALVTMAVSSPVSAEDAYDIYIYAVRLPLRANGLWAPKATAVVSELYTNKYLVSDVGSTLDPSYIIQNGATLAGETLWFPVRVVAKSGKKINVNMLRFTQHSSDTANSLANSANLVGGNNSYNPQTMGVIWGSGGEYNRNSDTELSSGNGSAAADELIFVGLQSTYYPYNSSQSETDIRNYINTQNLALTTTVEVVDGGVVVARASRTLQVLPNFGKPTLSIFNNRNGMVSITVRGPADNSIILQSSLTGKPNSWVTEAIGNSGDVITRAALGPVRLYRAMLQPAPR